MFIAMGGILSSCSSTSQGNQLAATSCKLVVKGLNYFDKSQQLTNLSERQDLNNQATGNLEAAQPIAAQAAQINGKWQALMTTLQEVDRVPITNLKIALDVQCSNALGHKINY